MLSLTAAVITYSLYCHGSQSSTEWLFLSPIVSVSLKTVSSQQISTSVKQREQDFVVFMPAAQIAPAPTPVAVSVVT